MRRLLATSVLLLLVPGLCATAGAGSKATNFTVRDINSKHVRLSDFSTKLVLLNFWATWCKPCMVELKHLEKIYQKYRSRGFVVLAVSMDGSETQAKVKPFIRRYKLSFPVVVDSETHIVKLYNPKHSAPFSVYINRGRVVKQREGFQVSDLPAIEKEIADLLK